MSHWLGAKRHVPCRVEPSAHWCVPCAALNCRLPGEKVTFRFAPTENAPIPLSANIVPVATVTASRRVRIVCFILCYVFKVTMSVAASPAVLLFYIGRGR